MLVLLAAAGFAVAGPLPPSIIKQPADQSVLVNSNAVFSISATGQGTLLYQWTFNGTNLANNAHISGVTSTNLVISGVSAVDAGTYQVSVTDNRGTAVSSNAVLTVLFPAAIVSQPEDQSVIQGSNASFTLTASGTAPLSYQWLQAGVYLTNNSRLSGVNNNVLTLAGASTNDAGAYQVIVTNYYGCVTSSVAALSVWVPPFLVSSPQNQTAILTSNVQFTASVGGTAPLGYQWFFNGAPLVDGGPINGSATATVSLSNVQAANAGWYWLVATNPWGAITSQVAALQIILPPTISAVANQRTFSHLATTPVTFTVADPQTPAADLMLSGNSSNPSLVANSNIVFNGAGADRSVTVIPSGNSGTALITITVTNAYGASASTAFQLTMGDFTEVNANLLPLDDASIAWGDYDNDGRLDLLVTGQNTTKPYGGGGETTKIYHNNGDDTFTDIGANLLGVIGGGAVWGDYNNDGQLDVLVAGSYAVYLQSIQYGLYIYGSTFSGRVYRNDGAYLFTQSANLLDGAGGADLTTRFTSLGWGDYDNDGKLDPLLASIWNGVLFHNNGQDNFASSGINLPGEVYCTIAWSDYNNDGQLDFVESYGWPTTWQRTDLYQNTSGTNFVVSTNAFPGICSASLAWEDCNHDGILDLAMVGHGVNGLFIGDGQGNFTNVMNLDGGDNASVAWGDFDNDGWPDLVITSYGGTRIYRNNGDGTFSDLGMNLPGASNGGVTVGDYNNDGCLDIAINGGGTTKIFRNDGTQPKPPPASPANLSVTLTTNAAVFTWFPAAGISPTNGFSYNLRVGTTPGGVDVLSPMADPATGLRRVPALGNAGLCFSHSLNHLNPGTYYCGVQAIDHRFIGSAFTGEQSFTLVAPYILAQPQSQTNFLGDTVTFTVAGDGTGPLAFQWYFNGQRLMDNSRISGSTATNLTLANLQASDAGNYTVVIGNLSGSVTSQVASVTILNPLVTTQPQSQTVMGGGNATFTITATGQQPLAYQWRYNGDDIPDDTNSFLVLTNLYASQSGLYSVLVTNLYGMLSSSNAQLIVNPLTITTQPSTNRVTWVGGNISFSVTVSGRTPFSYSWQYEGADVSQFNNARVVSNLFSSQLILTNVSLSEFGRYRALISNPYGAVISSNALLAYSQIAVWGGNQGETNLTTGLTNIIAITAGSSACLALKSNGVPLGWPSAYFGPTNVIAIAGANPNLSLQSNGVVNYWYTGAVAGLTNIVAMAPRNYGYLALNKDGNVVGNLSIAGLSNIVSISEGQSHSLALRRDGWVSAWGNNSYGQITVPQGLSNVVAISAGYYHSLALRSNGTLVAWGQNTSGQATIPGGLSNIVAIAAGGFHNLALRRDGTVVAWGMNSFGQTNVPALLTNVVAIAAGQYTSLALLGDGPPKLQSQLAQINLNTNGFSLTVPSQSGRVFVLQYKDSLADSNWLSLPLVPGTGGNLLLRDPSATNAQRYYQVQRW